MSARRWLADALALGTLGIIAWTLAGFLLRDDIFIYGDHPGQFWRMWYTINDAWQTRHRLIDWMPQWYAGYPELQFYPPGFVLVGWLLNLVTLGRISVALIYETVAFVAFALPGFTFYYAFRHFAFDRRSAFVAGTLGLVFPSFIAGANALFIGMIGSRLAFALNALALAWGTDWLERRDARYAVLAALALAGIILAHPYHVVGMTIALGLYILARRLPILDSGARLGLVALGAVALDAFWLVPLIAHSSTAMSPIIQATFDQTWRLLTDAMLGPYVLGALFALVLWRQREDTRQRALALTMAGVMFVVGAMMLAEHLILIERLDFYRLNGIRLVGEYYFALIWLAAIGVSRLNAWVFAIPFRAKIARAFLTWGITLLVSMFALIVGWQSVADFHPRENAEPRFMNQARAEYRLEELWETLRAEEGRVLFTSFYAQLNRKGDLEIPTTLPALTPLFANRQTMGGTFTHWSPIAALMWVGDTNPPVLWGRVEEIDDRALFGVPLEDLDDARVYDYCRRFNITTIVATINDFRARTFLDASPRFESYYSNGYFFAYRVKEYTSAWIDAQNSDVALIAFGDDEIVLRVRAAQADARVNVKVYAYPLWQARTDAGQSLAIARDDLALMRIALPRGENYTVTPDVRTHLAKRLPSLGCTVGPATAIT